jgi:hypothetical protein
MPFKRYLKHVSGTKKEKDIIFALRPQTPQFILERLVTYHTDTSEPVVGWGK